MIDNVLKLLQFPELMLNDFGNDLPEQSQDHNLYRIVGPITEIGDDEFEHTIVIGFVKAQGRWI